MCEITFEQAKEMGFVVRTKEYEFLQNPIVFVDLETFRKLPRIRDHVSLDVAMVKNGLIGLLDPDFRDQKDSEDE